MRTETKPVQPTFAANSLPPERDEALSLTVVGDGDRTVSAGTHAAVTAVLAAPRSRPSAGQVTAADFARQIQWSEGYVSMYRNAAAGEVLGFDVRGFEAAAEAWLAAREVMAVEDSLAASHVMTTVAEGVAAFVREMEKMQAVGVVLGDAGIGKTCALRLVRKASPRTVMVTASKWCEGAAQIAAAIFRAMGMREGKRASGSRMERVAKELHARPRTLLIDNAHQLSPGALRLIFNLADLHEGEADRPQCPVILCGNPEIEDKLRANDQFRSRLARVYDANGAAARANEFAAPLVKRMVQGFMPGLTDARGVVTAACRVAEAPEGGRFRAVAKALRYASDLMAAGRCADPVEAFAKAHSVLKLEKSEG